MKPSCVIGDSSAIYLAGLGSFLAAYPTIRVLAQETDPGQLLAGVDALAPDLVLLGFEPLRASLEVARRIDCPVLLFTWSQRRQDVSDAIHSPARGLLHKNAGLLQVKSTIESVLAGNLAFPAASLQSLLPEQPAPRALPNSARLTRREREILELLSSGMATRQVATTLGIAGQTVKNHVRNLMVKAGVTSRRDLALWAEGIAAAVTEAERRTSA